MSIKLALLKSGESVIADIKELVSGDKICGYLFDNPHTIDYRTSEFLIEEDSVKYNKDSARDLEVCLTPWIIFSQDEKIPVNPDWIVSIVKPIPSVAELYEDKINGQNNQTDNSDQQRDLSE